jgi:hypothetical protein
VTEAAKWELVDFLPRLDDWIAAEHPLEELTFLVTDWIFTRLSDPFANARRVEGFADYWQAVVPNSDHFDDYAERSGVVCLYWVDVTAGTVRCDRIATLSLPID